jgi:hypothetical protein
MASSSSGQEEGLVMSKVLGAALRERLGEDGVRALDEYVQQQAAVWRSEVVNTCSERLHTRLQNYAGKNDVLDGFNKVLDKLAETKIELTDRMSNMRVELVRYSFAFWLGQILAFAAILWMLIR